MEDFEDIRIIDLDVDKTKPSKKASEMRWLYLKLSSLPANTWNEFFNQSRQQKADTNQREAWVEGDYIIIDCVPNELETHHLKELKENVLFANDSCRKIIDQRKKDEDDYSNKQKKEKDKLNELRKRLQFD